MNQESLTHYGVPGMKWGVRKDSRSTGSNKRASKKYTFNGQKALGVALMAVGGTALAYYAVKNGQTLNAMRATSKILKAGTQMQVITPNSQKAFDRPFYAAYKKEDMKRYEGYLGKQRQVQNRLKEVLGKTPTDGVYKVKLTTTKDLKIAGKKDANKIFNELKKTDPKFTVTDGYDAFNRSLVGGNAGANGEKFYNALKKSGFQGLVDMNDVRYSGYKAKAPVIIIDTEAVVKNSVSKMKDQDINNKYIKEQAKLGAQSLHMFGLGSATAVTGYTLYDEAKGYK